jgi:hypothetical protein
MAGSWKLVSVERSFFGAFHAVLMWRRFVLLRHTSSDVVRKRFHVFNSFFFKKLDQNKDFTRLQRWTKAADLFSKDFWVVPIHDRWAGERVVQSGACGLEHVVQCGGPVGVLVTN